MNDEPRGNWYLLTGLVLGVVIGLVLSLGAYPVRYSDSEPSALAESYRSEYRRLIADAYGVDANLPRAQARLDLLKDADPARALAAQAQRVLADGGGPDDARSLALLAAVLNGSAPTLAPVPDSGTPTAQTPSPAAGIPTAEIFPTQTGTIAPDSGVSTATPQTPTLTPVPSLTPLPTFTPRPSATPPQVLEAPFTLSQQSDVCDSSLPPGLIVVEVRNHSGAPQAGVRIQVAWDGGQDTFYTGLSPEISPGYADFKMTQGTTYTLRVGDAGAPVSGIIIPTCGGSKKYEFQAGGH